MICCMSDYVPNSKQDRSFFDRKKQAVKNLDKHYKKIKLDPSGHYRGEDRSPTSIVFFHGVKQPFFEKQQEEAKESIFAENEYWRYFEDYEDTSHASPEHACTCMLVAAAFPSDLYHASIVPKRGSRIAIQMQVQPILGYPYPKIRPC